MGFDHSCPNYLWKLYGFNIFQCWMLFNHISEGIILIHCVSYLDHSGQSQVVKQKFRVPWRNQPTKAEQKYSVNKIFQTTTIFVNDLFRKKKASLQMSNKS